MTENIKAALETIKKIMKIQNTVYTRKIKSLENLLHKRFDIHKIQIKLISYILEKSR